MATLPSNWSAAVPLIKDGDPVSAAFTNPPLNVLTARTDDLRRQLDQATAGQQLLWRRAPLAAGTTVGQLVYWDAPALCHAPALAGFQSALSEDGRLVPTAASMYTGLVLSMDTAVCGTLLLSGLGVLSAPGVIALFGQSNPAPGVYYLSANTPGVVTAVAPAAYFLAVQYLGAGMLRVLPVQTPAITHSHSAYRLLHGAWVALPDDGFPGAPANATFGYSFLLDPLPATAVVPMAGLPTAYYVPPLAGDSSSSSSSAEAEESVHVDEFIQVTATGIWWTAAWSPVTDIRLLVTTPDVRGVSLLASLQSLSPDILSVLTQNGRATIAYQELTLLQQALAGAAGWTVVKGLSGHRLVTDYVVSRVRAGRGLKASATQGTDQGEISLQLAVFDDLFLEAQLLNLDNAATDVDGAQVFVTFPAGRSATVNGRVILPNFGDAHYVGYLRVLALSPAPNQTAPAAEVTLVPKPTAGGVAQASPATVTLPAFPSSIVAGKVYLSEAATPIDLVGCSQGIYSFSLTLAPSANFRMLSCGLRLSLA